MNRDKAHSECWPSDDIIKIKMSQNSDLSPKTIQNSDHPFLPSLSTGRFPDWC